MNRWNVDDLRPGLDRDQLRIAEFTREMANKDLNPHETMSLTAGAAERLIAAGQAAEQWAATLGGMI